MAAMTVALPFSGDGIFVNGTSPGSPESTADSLLQNAEKILVRYSTKTRD